MKEKKLIIPNDKILEYLVKTEQTKSKLGDMLGVEASTITRWAAEDKKYRQHPTSTALLVLIPLMMAEGIDVLPEPKSSHLTKFIKDRMAEGFLTEKDLKNPKIMRSIRAVVAKKYNSHCIKSRELFEKLKVAWDKIDKTVLAK